MHRIASAGSGNGLRPRWQIPLPNMNGETLQKPSAGGASGAVERATDTASSCAVQLSSIARRFGRGIFNPPVPQLAYLSGARGYRTREPRWGDGGAALCKRRGATTWITLSGRGRGACGRSAWGRASPHLANAGPARKEASTQWKDPQTAGASKARAAPHPRGKKESLHAVEDEGSETRWPGRGGAAAKGHNVC